jgi:hypothetical protein
MPLMKTRHRPLITEEQQALLDGVEMRLILREDRQDSDRLMASEPYLGNAQLVGEQLRYVAEYREQ